MIHAFKKLTASFLLLGASCQVIAAPGPPLAAPEIDGSLGLQVLALGVGLAFLLKRKKK